MDGQPMYHNHPHHDVYNEHPMGPDPSLPLEEQAAWVIKRQLAEAVERDYRSRILSSIITKCMDTPLVTKEEIFEDPSLSVASFTGSLGSLGSSMGSNLTGTAEQQKKAKDNAPPGTQLSSEDGLVSPPRPPLTTASGTAKRALPSFKKKIGPSSSSVHSSPSKHVQNTYKRLLKKSRMHIKMTEEEKESSSDSSETSSEEENEEESEIEEQKREFLYPFLQRNLK
jgi:hypothetical protein